MTSSLLMAARLMYFFFGTGGHLQYDSGMFRIVERSEEAAKNWNGDCGECSTAGGGEHFVGGGGEHSTVPWEEGVSVQLVLWEEGVSVRLVSWEEGEDGETVSVGGAFGILQSCMAPG